MARISALISAISALISAFSSLSCSNLSARISAFTVASCSARAVAWVHTQPPAFVGRVALSVGGHVAVGAVGAQVVLVLATSSWGKSLAVLHAALLCSSRSRPAAAMSLAGRAARRRDAREHSRTQRHES